jgi:hypothetical protein
MMNDLASPPLPPVPTQRDVQTLVDLISLLADPAATKTRLAVFSAAADAARKIVDQAAADSTAANALRARTERELGAARQAHDATIATEHDAHQEAMRTARAEIEAEKKAVESLKASAEADAAKAAELKAEMSRRLRVMEGA